MPAGACRTRWWRYSGSTNGPPPYVLFPGNAEEALRFYLGVFGGALQLATYAAFGRGNGLSDAIAHGVLDGTVRLYAADAGFDLERGNGLDFTGIDAVTNASGIQTTSAKRSIGFLTSVTKNLLAAEAEAGLTWRCRCRGAARGDRRSRTA